MDLENQTPFVARLLRVEGEEAKIQATLVVKATFERGPDAGKRWIPAAEQVPIVDDKLETPFGVFHTDCFVRKEGIDICVVGTVRPPHPTKKAELRLTVGTHSSELLVFGDRSWVTMGTKLVPSSPAAFEEMPLGYTRAYGGVTEHDYETVTWADNPVGRGYYLSPEQAVGKPLPNIEPGRGPFVREWSDQPQVAGWGPYPLFWGIRAREGIHAPQHPSAGAFARLTARLNNNAHPSLIVPAINPNDEIRICGMKEEEMVFTIPRVAPVAEVQVGTQTASATGHLDGVCIWADSGRVTVTQRLYFTYTYERGVPRYVRLIDASSERAT